MLSLGSVLVPLDGSELAEGVLAHVERLVKREPCTVHLLRVTGGPDAARRGVDRQVEEAQARESLQTSRARLEKAGAKVEVHLAHGDPAAEILAAATRLKVGLLAMCSHGASGVLRWIRGSVAEAILREATIPVLLVSAHSAKGAAPERFKRILVTLDGTERSASIIPYVLVLARDADAEVVLLRVEWEAVQRPYLAMALAPEKVAETLKPWRDRLASAGVKVRVLVAQGDAAAEILDVADREQADLVALSTHGKTGLTRFLDGSVAEKVLRHSKHPLLVVRAPSH